MRWTAFAFLCAFVPTSIAAPIDKEVHYQNLERRAQTFACGQGNNKVALRLQNPAVQISDVHPGDIPFLDYKDGDLAGTKKTYPKSSRPEGNKVIIGK